VTSVARITLETQIYSAYVSDYMKSFVLSQVTVCRLKMISSFLQLVTVTWRAPFFQVVTLTRVSVCVSQG